MMYFMDTVETIPDGVGFSHFNGLHLAWMMISLVFFVVMCVLYKRCSEAGRKKFRHGMAYALLGNELFKNVCLLIGGTWIPKYLPLHMCSLNIFLIVWHAFKPNKLLGNYLYAVCVPTAIIAIVAPSWVKLPLWNFMNLHSFTIHMCLAAYPLMLTVAGDIRPHPKYMFKCVGLAAFMAVPIYLVNLLLDTNFMFLMRAGSGNPLQWFEQHMGNHLWGLPILGAVLLGIMYLIAYPVWGKKRMKSAAKQERM